MSGHPLAPTPPMGWNSWNTFGAHITEADVRATADAFVERGFRDAGYRYLVIDDFWEADERVNGELTWNRETFPAGIPALAEYVHSLDLKLGIYSCAGTRTCGGKPGSFAYEFEDARTFASWGVDYLKYDCCFLPPGVSMEAAYRRMGQALRESGRDIVYSLCNWGLDDVWVWARETGAHLWRSTGDIQDRWHSIYKMGFRDHGRFRGYHGGGCWNDPDMLVVGMRGASQNEEVIAGEGEAGCTDAEYRTHFALWCLVGAPLLIGADVRALDEPARELLLNPRLIAINQDPLGAPARHIGSHREVDVWARPLADGDVAVAFFNLSKDRQDHGPVAWETLGLEYRGRYRATDVFTGGDAGVHQRLFDAPALERHDAAVFRLRRER